MAFRVYVTISSYSFAEGMVGRDIQEHYRSEPMTPKQASKWLAMLIRGKTAAAIQTRKCIPYQRGARFFIETPRGGEYSLIQFRQTFL